MRACCRAAALVWLVVAALCAAAPGVAQAPADAPALAPAVVGPSAQDLEHARTLFEEGLALVEQELWEQAALRFAEVLKLKASAVVAYNLASVLAKAGRNVEAAEVLRGIAHDPAAADEARDGAQQLLSEIEPMLGSLSVRLSGPTDGVTVVIGVRVLAVDRATRPVEIDPGEHVVEAHRDGAALVSTTVRVGNGDPMSVVVPLTIPPRAPSPQEVAAAAQPLALTAATTTAPRDGEPELYERWWFWAGAGALVATAVVTGLLVSGGGGDGDDPVRGDIGPAVIMGRVVPAP